MGLKEKPRILFALAAFSILLFTGLQNFSQMINVLDKGVSFLAPFLIGICIAFILNVPMSGIEQILFARKQVKGKWERPLCLFLTLFIIVLIVTVVLFLIIPELVKTAGAFTDNLPQFYQRMQKWVQMFLKRYPGIREWFENFTVDWDNVFGSTFDYIHTGTGNLLNSTILFVSGIIKFFAGLVFAIYILLEKEKFLVQFKQILYSLFKEHQVEQIIRICNLSSKIFANFLTGQCIEALILGTIFFVAMSVFRFPYPLLIGVLISITALIPVAGSFVGCVIGAFLIWMTNPIGALWFVIMFLGIQQIEGNFIFPKVVGDSVGLPAIWVMAAVTLGGSMFGVGGILLFIPLCAILYTLFREYIHKRLIDKNVIVTKW